MAEKKLLIRNDKSKHGLYTIVSKKDSILKYVTMSLLKLNEGETILIGDNDLELGIVINSGNIQANGISGKPVVLNSRKNQFSGRPHAIYIPAGSSVTIKTLSKLEAAIYGSPAAKSGRKVTVIKPEDIKMVKIGEGNWYLEGFFILGKNVDAERLIIGETWIPEGNWSSCPPHSHDKDIPGKESLLEEIYYFRFLPSQGFGFQGIYTDERDLDEAYIIRDGDVVIVPKGYHPNVSGPGYKMRMQWGMAGPKRTWLTYEDPDHEWIANKPNIKGVKENNF